MPTLKEQYLAMDSANRFLLEHCEKTLEEIRRAYQGISHSVNRCNAEYADCREVVEELRERAELHAQESSESNAAIGQLQQDVVAMAESLQKARNAYSELKKAVDRVSN